MGYRSQIRIRLRKEDYERLVKEFENDQKVKNAGAGNLFKTLDKYVEETNYVYYENHNGKWIEKTAETVYFGWDYVKWYDGYEDVDFIMDWLVKDDKIPYAFTRIGESMEGDIDMRYNIFDEIFVYFGFDDNSEGV